MNITEVVSFDKDGKVEHFPLFRKLFLSVIIILVAILSFGVGRLTVVGNREPIKVEFDPALTASVEQSVNTVTQSANVINSTRNGGVVVSKNGTRYHFPHCSGAKQIKEENKIVFATPQAAQAAGYTLAANCLPKQ